MKWLRAAFWVSLLVVLLGGSTVARGRDLPWSESGVARGTPTEAAPDDYVRSGAGWQQSLGARLQRDPPAPGSTQQLRRLRHRDQDGTGSPPLPHGFRSSVS
jgi:hypothetical protein